MFPVPIYFAGKTENQSSPSDTVSAGKTEKQDFPAGGEDLLYIIKNRFPLHGGYGVGMDGLKAEPARSLPLPVTRGRKNVSCESRKERGVVGG